ncbi:MAG: GTP 3',8-cyclase MoaA [Deltaproteobacteria bacterium]|nr:GTP 3',8-cyclase MoaA [Deltaproteobacteria bacterium]
MNSQTPILDHFQRPLRDLRLSVTDKCNFRCPYCMPKEVFGDEHKFSPKSEILSFEEIIRLCGIFVAGGVEKIRVTGGEPLIRKDITELIAVLSRLDGLKDLSLTTNGWLLAEKVEDLRRAGLKRITVSLDSLDNEVFGRMNGQGHGVGRVLEGIEAARRAGLSPIKINVVIRRGENLKSILDIAEHFRGTGIIPRYIEFMDVGTRNDWNMSQVVPSAEVVETIAARWPLEPLVPNYSGEVASRYRYADGQGEIGVISSISSPFCRSCTRARLTTSGQLVKCLFAPGGTSLRDMLRAGADDKEILRAITDLWTGRQDRYSEERTSNTPLKERPKIEMYQVGG